MHVHRFALLYLPYDNIYSLWSGDQHLEGKLWFIGCARLVLDDQRPIPVFVTFLGWSKTNVFRFRKIGGSFRQ